MERPTGSPRQYTVDEVSDLLGLHAKTVRGYVRDGKLKATRVGKRYRIAADDLAEFTGRPVESTARESASRVRRAEATTIVHVDAVAPATVGRVSTMLGAIVMSGPGEGESRLRVETIYEEERAALKVILIGSLEPVTDALRLLTAMVEDK
ncbi:helix-turn-helix domain-containing protein [Streptomyces sp. NPDC002845]